MTEQVDIHIYFETNKESSSFIVQCWIKHIVRFVKGRAEPLYNKTHVALSMSFGVVVLCSTIRGNDGVYKDFHFVIVELDLDVFVRTCKNKEK